MLFYDTGRYDTVNGFTDDYLLRADGEMKVGIRREWGATIIFFGMSGGGPGIGIEDRVVRVRIHRSRRSGFCERCEEGAVVLEPALSAAQRRACRNSSARPSRRISRKKITVKF